MDSTRKDSSKAATPLAPRYHWKIWLVRLGVLFLAIFLVGGVVAYNFAYDAMKSWVESPTGANVAAQGLGKAIKVEGTFSPIHLNGWNIQTDSFSSVGWPGEAIGMLDATNVRAEFVPAAIWDRAWKISGVQMDRATLRLDKPNDALKRVMPPKKPRPWYAFFLPNRFECGPIVCPDSDLEFTFQDTTSWIRDAHVQADLIGKDLKYTATSGVLEFPYLPPMRIEHLEMKVTRPEIDIYSANLAGIDPRDTARISLRGRIGMREDKSIDAKLTVVDVPIEQVLPENLRSLIQCKVTGDLHWQRDVSGKEIVSDGNLKLVGASIHSLSVFKEVAMLNDNPDLQDFVFDEASCHFHRENNIIHIDLIAKCTGKFTITGTVDFHILTKTVDMDVAVTDLPLKVWLPSDFKSKYDGVAKAHLRWSGQLDTMKESTAAIDINLNGTHISEPVMLQRLLAKKGFRTPTDINLDTAELSLTYQNDVFNLTRAVIDAPGVLSATATGTMNADRDIHAQISWEGLKIAQWLPPDLASQFCADVNGNAQAEIQHWQMKDGSYGGFIKLLDGEIQYTGFQSLFGRFVNDRSLLTMHLDRAQFYWQLDGQQIVLKDIDLFVAGKLGIKGNVTIDPQNELSGFLLVGVNDTYLKSLSTAGSEVFNHKEEGLSWAKVSLSGTIKKPKQDLTPQIVSKIVTRPLVVIRLGVKIISWYIGDLFGEAEKWLRPATTQKIQ